MSADESTAAHKPRADHVDLGDEAYYFNRELSWLQFNERVLELAEDSGERLLERFKFAAIFCSNLDEFFMIRVAGLHDQLAAGVEKRTPDGRTPLETFGELRERTAALVARLARCMDDSLIPRLAEHGVEIARAKELTEAQRSTLKERFAAQIFPVLTPLAVGPGRPFPYISNLSLSLGVLLRDPQSDQTTFARVKVPKEMLPRFLTIEQQESAPGAPAARLLVPLEDVIADNLGMLFPGTEVLSYVPFRVSRDTDFTVSDEADDLLRAVEQELRRRRFGEVVRIEIGAGADAALRAELMAALDVDERDIYEQEGILDLGDLWEIVRLTGMPELHDKPWTPVVHPRLRDSDGEAVPVMSAMRQGDILVHHPYDSFASSVERFVEEAVADPDVLAIKQTVYRTSDDSPLVPALIRASERGKQAVCMVEVKARFDEQANIQWARALEQAGVHVVYGHPGLKTHAKCVLVVRREGEGVRNYVHVGTGNYHPSTARLYTDLGLFTTDEQIGADVADMFNFLTGFSHPRASRRVWVAPHGMREGLLAEIDRTIKAQKAGTPCRIVMKMNSLVDKKCVRALYKASRAGVPVQLNVRGVCCLRPGVAGVSDNIEVVSLIGRFLEHSRVFAFLRGDETAVYIGSADLMPRNLDHRVELITPVDNAEAKAQVLDAVERCLADDTHTWALGEDGVWRRRAASGRKGRSAQSELMKWHTARLEG
jgi:polyphosphate kinase